jgi:ketosteroid isomerase-like protein
MTAATNRRTLLAWATGVLLTTSKGVSSMPTSNEARCAAYLDAWSRKDLEAIAAHLHPDVHFKGPMQELNGKPAVLESTRRIFPLLERLHVRGQFVSGDRAVLVYDFVCKAPLGVCRTAEMVRFDGGLVRETELFFDARPFAALQAAAPK